MRTGKLGFAQACSGLLLATAAVVGLASEAGAGTRFDGLWSVSIVTQRGNCDRSLRYPVAITNGVVQQAVNQSLEQIDVHRPRASVTLDCELAGPAFAATTPDMLGAQMDWP